MSNKAVVLAAAAGAALLLFTEEGNALIGGDPFGSAGGGSGGSANEPTTLEEGKQVAAPSTYSFSEQTSTQDFISAFINEGIGGQVTTYNGTSYGAPQTFVQVPYSKKAQEINDAAVRSNVGSDAFAFLSFTDSSGNILGGSDNINMQSVTAERARNTVNNKKVESLNKSGGGSSLNYTPVPKNYSSAPRPTVTPVVRPQNYSAPTKNYSEVPTKKSEKLYSSAPKNYSSVK